MLLLLLCRRRSEEVCWTTWAVATPGAEGVGRLPSRSKWGRYRPKNGFLFVPLWTLRRRYAVFSLQLRFAASGKLGGNLDESRFEKVFRLRSILVRRVQKYW